MPGQWPGVRAVRSSSAATAEGKVYALTLPPPGVKGEALTRVIASGLREPAGVAFRDGALYVSAVDRASCASTTSSGVLRIPRHRSS